MSRSSALIILGVLTMLAPYSGFPSPIRSLSAFIFGACVLGIGLAMRTRPAPPTPAEPLPPVEPTPPTDVSPI